jgi:hypothetical protein
MLHSSEHEQIEGPGHSGDRQLLVGVDAPITPATQYALRTIGAFFAPYAAHLHLLPWGARRGKQRRTLYSTWQIQVSSAGGKCMERYGISMINVHVKLQDSAMQRLMLFEQGETTEGCKHMLEG